MKNRQPFALVDIRWLPLGPFLQYPRTSAFALTGYRETEGPRDLFSVYLKTLDGEPGPGNVQSAKLYALVDSMRVRLPKIGATFLLSTGTTIVAECLTNARGEDEPEQ